LAVQRVVLPVHGAEASGDRTRIHIASMLHDGLQVVPVFSSEDKFNASPSAGNAGLLLHVEQLVRLLHPDDEVALDLGTPGAVRCRTTDLIALVMWLHREG
jgi:hypothetical protein